MPFHLVKSRAGLSGIFIFALALVFRAAYLQDYQGNPFFGYVPPAFDQYNFDLGAQAFANGDWLARSPNNQYSPIYKYFLGTIYSLFGRNFRAVFFFHYIIGSLSAVLVFLAGRRLFGYWTGLLSAIAFSAYGPNLFYEGKLLREFLVPFFALLSIYALICFKERPTTLGAALCGIPLSLLLQNRPNVVFIFPLLFFYFKDMAKTEAAGKIKILLLSFFLFSLPVLFQCYLVHHRFVFYDDSGPITLLTGNVADFSGSEWTVPPTVEKFLKEKDVTYPNVFREILKGMTGNPAAFLALYGRKALYLFHAREFPSNLNYYMFQKFSPLLNTPWSRFSLFTSFGLVGMAFGLSEFRRLKLLYIFFAGISLSMLIVYVPGRFRLPLVPIIMLFAFYALSKITAALREGSYKKVLILACSTAALFLLFDKKLAGEKIRDIDYVHLGEAYNQRGEKAKALAAYKMAAMVNPYCQNAYQGILSVLESGGMTKKAIEALEEGRRKAPAMDFLSYELANLYLKTERPQKAEEVYRWMLDRKPGDAELRNDLAVVLIKSGKMEEAAKELRRALEIRPDLEAAKNNLEKLLTLL